MNYISTQEAAEKWGVSLRHVQRLLHENRIPDARKYGVSWLIPANAEKPADPRRGQKAARAPKAAKKAAPSGSECAAFPVLHIHGGNLTDAYKRCQSDEERTLLEAWVAIYRGNACAADDMATALLQTTSQPRIRLGCWLLRASTAMYAGDVAAWKMVVEECSCTHVPEEIKMEREFAVAAIKVMLHGRCAYPRWLETGAFTGLCAELFPAACWMYVEILYVEYKEIDLVAVAEPLIAMCHREQSDVSEIYLRLFAAIAYLNCNDKAHAREHLQKAVDLAIPLGFMSPFWEYRRMLATVMDPCLKTRWPEALAEVKKRTQPFMDHWSRVYLAVWGEPLSNGLTQREYEVCLLASRGLMVCDIVARTGLSKSSVKKYLNVAYAKLGVKERKELRQFFHHP